eukprot:1161992-Pelagomonas_calceolata.AAC.10
MPVETMDDYVCKWKTIYQEMDVRGKWSARAAGVLVFEALVCAKQHGYQFPAVAVPVYDK